MEAKNIVVATDFSDSSEAALRLAASLARDTGATLQIVHVKEPFSVYKLGSQYGDVAPYPELDTLKTVLAKAVPADSNVPYRHWLFTGEHVAGEILRLADELEADFIVMGTHGRGGISRLLMGSVAEGVIRGATCPVLTLKRPRQAVVEPVPGPLPS